MKTRTKEQTKYYKLLFLCVKYIPAFSTLLLVIHAALCLMGYEDSICDNLVKTPITRSIMMLIASYAFGFCRFHRWFVLYNFIVSILITIHVEVGLGFFLLPCEWLTLIIGIVLLTILGEHWQEVLKYNGDAKNYYHWVARQD